MCSSDLAFHSVIGSVVNLMGGQNDTFAISFGVAVVPAGLLLGTAGFTFLLLKEKFTVKSRAEAIP